MAIADPVPGTLAGPTRSGATAVRPQERAWHREALDSLRVLAALAVLITNVGGATGAAFTGSPLSWLVTRGDVGVPIFFALSGFLLYRPWVIAAVSGQPGPDVRGYAKRRVLRIVPAYWVVVVVALLTVDRAHAGSASTWVQYLFGIQIYNAHPWWAGTGAAGLGQMWSLAVDASYYLLLPFLAVLLTGLAGRGAPELRIRARRLLGAVTVLGLSSYGFLALVYRPGAPSPWLSSTLPAMMTWFAAGMAVAVVSAWANAEPGPDGPVRVFCRTVASSAPACLLIAALLFVIACTPAAGPEGFTLPTLWQSEIKAALYTAIAIAVLAPIALQPAAGSRLANVLGGAVPRYLGRISYGVFLWQGLVILGVLAVANLRGAPAGGAFTITDTVAVAVAVLAATCLAAAISDVIIERPVRSLGGRWHQQAGDQASHHDQA